MSLDKLQEIRERRLEKQQIEVRNRKSEMVLAEQQLMQARQNLDDFRQWRLNQQEGLFSNLQGQSCSPQNMLEYRAQIEKLAQEEEPLKELITKANEQLKITQESYAQAKKVVTELDIKNEKTKEIIDIHEKIAIEAQRTAEE